MIMIFSSGLVLWLWSSGERLPRIWGQDIYKIQAQEWHVMKQQFFAQELNEVQECYNAIPSSRNYLIKLRHCI